MEYSKYVSVAIDELAMPVIMVFPANFSHIEMEHCLKNIGLRTTISAGFVDEFLQCYGESSSLRLKSKDGDTELLHKQLNIDDKKLKFRKE